MDGYKYCPSCKEYKKLEEFYKCKSKKDGRRSWCITCSKKKQRERSDYFREYNRNRYANDPEFRKKILSSRRKQRVDNPEKNLARVKLYQSLKRKNVVKKPCIVCQDKNSQAHHYDYKKPTSVIWLCPKHHRLLHLTRLDLILKDYIPQKN